MQCEHEIGRCSTVLVSATFALSFPCIPHGHWQQTAVPTFSGVNSRFSSKIEFYATFAAHVARGDETGKSGNTHTVSTAYKIIIDP